VIGAVVSWCARHSRAVVLAAAAVGFASFAAQRSLPRDAVPDLSDPQLVLVGEWMGHPASEVAAVVTAGLTHALDGLPGATAVRGSSMAGMAYVDVVFGSVTSLAAARGEVLARVERLRAGWPPGVRVTVGPEASSTGWVFQYALMPPERAHAMPMGEGRHEGHAPLAPLRRFQDDVLRPALAAVPGVAEVATVGGDGEQVLLETTDDQLRGAGAAFSDVVAAARNWLAAGRAGTLDERLSALRGAPLDAAGNTLERVARVRVAPDMAGGMADVDGSAAIVSGIVVAKRGADVRAVVAGVRAVIDRERHHLPRGTRLGVVYDRSELVAGVEQTLRRTLVEEVAVVALVVLMFLLHGRSALVPMATLPLVVLVTFAALRLFGVPATVMSLGGIAIALGMAVDADLVALEACHRRLEAQRDAALDPPRRRALVVAAAGAFAPPILLSLLIAALAFVPVFAFGGETGRLLRPLALTKTLVILVAALVALTVAPALRDLALRGRIVPENGNPLTRLAVRAYRPFVLFALRRPVFTLVTAGLALLSCLPIIPRIGSEFLPRIDEGDLLYMPTAPPGVTPGDAEAELTELDAQLAERPEVANAFGKIGRASTATDPAPLSMAETIVRLRPRDRWPKVARQRWYSSWAPAPLRRLLARVWPEQTPPTTAELVESLDRSVGLTGWTNAWTAPVRARMDMMATGVRTPVGVRIVAADPARLAALGAAVQAAVLDVPGTRSAVFEAQGGETRLAFEPDRAALARHGVRPEVARAAADFLLAGGELGDLRSKDRPPLPVRVSLAAPWLPKPPEDVLRDATVRAGPDGAGQPVPLGLLGRPVFERVPAMLRAERGEPVAYVYVDVAEAADVGGYVDRARAMLAQSPAVRLLPGERIEWTGQYELLAAGQRRLRIVAPLVALTMLLLLCLQFRSLAEALIVLASVPFALVGSFWTLHLLGYRLSAPVWVGLLSVVGLAMQTGVVMVVYIDDAFQRRARAGRMRSRDDVVAAHAEGTVRRLRPKLMTISTMGAGLLPVMWSTGAGSEIMKRVAAPMLGGLVTSAFLTLEVIPVLYTLWRTRQLALAQIRGADPLEDPLSLAAQTRDVTAP
jgi:Cu(I)/Ag(I) efflux system membrane protein CusA/SilA